jgi:tRNA-Thr(GGU) m(6)t(6)A37 methyltransferase TsaA
MRSKNSKQKQTRSSAERNHLQLKPIGVIRSVLKERSKAPKQGSEGAPDVWIEVRPRMMQAVDGLAAGDAIIILTWLHRAHRDVLKVHPRSDPKRRLTGVFATRSPDRPNPTGLHEVTVRKVGKNRLRVGPIEAIDGTPVIDIKPIVCTPRPAETPSDSAVERHRS